MANESDSDCEYLIDLSGLHELAQTRSNRLKTICQDHLTNGVIGVLASVWSEFEELFETEAAALAPYVTHKIKMKQAYRVGAASIADKAQATFPLSPYDSYSDYYSASVCLVEGYTLLSSASQVSTYEKLDCFECGELSTLLH